jgi:2,4-dienoyl-CoA reductase-like NADH-dependent reductase (Old Yellow Enzyme family)
MSSLLLSPIQLRTVTARNRVVISPMCTYSAENGTVSDWHLVHLGKFALGGAGIVFVEATAIEARGRITHGDVGIWSDAHGQALGRIVTFLKQHGAVPALQLAHAGRKASMQRPWFGNAALTADDRKRGDIPWDIIAPSALPVAEGWLTPKAMDRADIDAVIAAFAAGAKRGLTAGFEIAEIHGAHGYLINSFLSPLSNKRTDDYGGSRAGRMRFALEVTEAVRAVWPGDKPLFFRVSAVDGVDGGWQLEDSVELARALKGRGVDVIDCSSGGILGSATAAAIPRTLGFQVPYAARIRRDAEIATQAVGLILDGPQAEAILQAGDADLIAVAREALVDPFWARHAAHALGVEGFADWPTQYGWWLERRAKTMARMNR